MSMRSRADLDGYFFMLHHAALPTLKQALLALGDHSVSLRHADGSK